MADPLKERVQKLYDSRAKAKAELKRVQQKVVDAVDNEKRRVRVNRLVNSCEEAMTKAFVKNEQLLDLAGKTENSEKIKEDLENWLKEVTVGNDAILKKARDYLDQCPRTENSSQSSGAKTTHKSKTSKTSTLPRSQTSSQRQRDLLIARQRREEIAKQNEATLRLAAKKHELELERMKEEQHRLLKEQALMVEELQEENRRKLAEATLTELALMEDTAESNLDFQEALSQLSAASRGKESARVSDWVLHSPTVSVLGNQLNPAPETSQTKLNLTYDASPVDKPADTQLLTEPEASKTSTTEPQGLQIPQPIMVTAPTATLTLPTSVTSTSTLPVSHVVPNLSAWTFPTVNLHPPASFTTNPLATPTTLTTSGAAAISSPTVTTVPVVPVTSGGTVFYVHPSP